MATSASTTYLITGASRGLGRGFVAAYLAQPDSTVIAAVRDPTSSSSKSLGELPKGANSSLIVVKLDSDVETDPADAVKQLKAEHNITSLDIVIANAGIMKAYPTVQEAKVESFYEHYRTNVVGVVLLFQAISPLLKASTKSGKFIVMGSVAGSITLAEKSPVPNTVYGASKAALNFITNRIHVENEEIVAVSVHPGFVQTPGGNSAAESFGMEKADITLDESIGPMLKLIAEATRESAGGKFKLYDGSDLPW
ncbi:hypothetical protein LTR84_010407 [Exophiala bonariae]|uniref:NAD(P)-binding protein n=1 Tax=Exophiala bonariae TaxID=1690606 RepID=A0AAV9MVB8_9EURO|nr:hypothetical protein LTR84_010407 [Exophiala bonariae]